jgi:acetylornithine deacetylase/succinyl-diaminopimelate desuccinylase-like protein
VQVYGELGVDELPVGEFKLTRKADAASEPPMAGNDRLAGTCWATAPRPTPSPPHRADQNRPEVRSLQQAARNQGYRGGFLRKHGAGDARFYYQRGVDAVAFGIGGDGQHGAGEYADTTTIAPYYRALREFLDDPGERPTGLY